MKLSAIEARNLMRWRVVEGAINGMYDTLYALRIYSGYERGEYSLDFCALFSEGEGFLRWKIDHDKSIGSCLAGILDRLVLSVRQQWVIVTYLEFSTC